MAIQHFKTADIIQITESGNSHKNKDEILVENIFSHCAITQLLPKEHYDTGFHLRFYPS